MTEQPIIKFNAAYPEIKDIGNDLKSLKNDIGHLGTHIKNEGMQDLSDVSADAYGSMKQWGQKVEKQIQAQPMQSLAIAFASGLAISLLMARR